MSDDVVGYARKSKWGSYDDQQVVLLAPGVDARFSDVYYDLRDQQVYNGDNPISSADAEELYRSYPAVKMEVDKLWSNPPDRATINASANDANGTNPDPINSSNQGVQPGLFESLRERLWNNFHSRRVQDQAQRAQRQQARAQQQQARAQAAAASAQQQSNGTTTNAGTNPAGPNGPNQGGASTNTSRNGGTTPPPNGTSTTTTQTTTIIASSGHVEGRFIVLSVLLLTIMVWFVVMAEGGTLLQQLEYVLVTIPILLLVGVFVRHVAEHGD